VIDQTGTASNDEDLASLEDAREHGVKAAIAIGSDEVARGKAFFGAEVLVENGEETLSRFIVAIGTLPLR
jgi:hypothetical protein